MNRNVVKAEYTVDKGTGIIRSSWPVPTAEVIVSKRTTRSSKPEVVYHLSPVEKVDFKVVDPKVPVEIPPAAAAVVP